MRNRAGRLFLICALSLGQLLPPASARVGRSPGSAETQACRAGRLPGARGPALSKQIQPAHQSGHIQPADVVPGTDGKRRNVSLDRPGAKTRAHQSHRLLVRDEPGQRR